jgi:hypothetical protein
MSPGLCHPGQHHFNARSPGMKQYSPPSTHIDFLGTFVVLVPLIVRYVL